MVIRFIGAFKNLNSLIKLILKTVLTTELTNEVWCNNWSLCSRMLKTPLMWPRLKRLWKSSDLTLASQSWWTTLRYLTVIQTSLRSSFQSSWRAWWLLRKLIWNWPSPASVKLKPSWTTWPFQWLNLAQSGLWLDWHQDRKSIFQLQLCLQLQLQPQLFFWFERATWVLR